MAIALPIALPRQSGCSAAWREARLLRRCLLAPDNAKRRLSAQGCGQRVD
jgi:hypothetical protein